MRKTFVAPLLIATLLFASGPVQASERGRHLFAMGLVTMALLTWGCIGTALYLRYSYAPNADTLMDFKRAASAQDTLFLVGGILQVPSLGITVAGSLTAFRDEPRSALLDLRPSLMVTGNGAGFGLGGRF
jgi:hypothetical protein